MNPFTGVAFTVRGTPAPQGSKRHVGHGVMVESGGDKLRTWREDVKHAAVDAMNGALPFDGPLELLVTFVLPRPMSVKREYPHVRPDLSKLVRSTEDAMTAAGVYRDDAQIVDMHVRKVYGIYPGAEIIVRLFDGDPQAVAA